MQKLSPGKMRTRIVIMRPSSETDSFGDASVKTWTHYANAWAEVIEKSGSEVYISERLMGVAHAIFRIRYMQVDSTMKITSGGRTWQIIGITNDPIQTETTITATEVL